jgi:hypothetical protein
VYCLALNTAPVTVYGSHHQCFHFNEAEWCSFSYSASFYFLWAGLLHQILQMRGCFLWFKKEAPQGEMLVIK